MVRLGAFTLPLDGEAIEARILVNRAYGDVENPYDASSLWRGGYGGFRVGAAPAAGGGAEAVEDESFAGLRALLERHPYTRYEQIDAEVADAAARALPFEHVALSARGAGPQMRMVENNLRSAYEQAFGMLAARPPRIEFFDDPLAPASIALRVQFGFGVFLPEDDARPEGEIEVAAPEGREDSPGAWGGLRLGDAQSDRPAGLYRGQSGLAFAAAIRHAPAVAPPGVLPEDHVFFYGRFSEEDAPRFRILPVDAARLSGALAYQEAPLGPAFTDGVAVLGPSGRPEFFCRLNPGDRAGALRPEPPAGGPCFRFEGLILPETGPIAPVKRWWVDFTRAGRLSVSPLDERAWAVANGPPGAGGWRGGLLSGGARVRLFNRAKQEEAGLYAVGDEIRLGRDPGGRDQTLFRRPLSYHPDADAEARLRWRVRLQARHPFGFAALGRAERRIVSARPSDDDAVLSLDWLDACGGVALSARDRTGAPQTEGLARWSLEGPPIRLRRVGGGGLEVSGDAPVRIAALENGETLRPVPPGRVLRLDPGDELALGCHHLRYLGAGAGLESAGFAAFDDPETDGDDGAGAWSAPHG